MGDTRRTVRVELASAAQRRRAAVRRGAQRNHHELQGHQEVLGAFAIKWQIDSVVWLANHFDHSNSQLN